MAGSEEGTGLEIVHTETGEHVHNVKTVGPCTQVAWHPERYVLAYVESGGLKIIGYEPERK